MYKSAVLKDFRAARNLSIGDYFETGFISVEIDNNVVDSWIF